jgi:hypothetical protein
MTAKKKTPEPNKTETAKPAAKKAAPKAAAAPKVAKPTAAKAPAAKKSTPKASAAQPVATLSPEQRYQRIQTEAYFIAERAGFMGDSSLHWIEAEKKVNAELA